MASGLKVRLDDGSEVGPLDLGMVQTWFERGLITRDTMVQRPGGSRWIRLAEASDLRQWNAPLVIAPRARGAAWAPPTEEVGEPAESGAERWRLSLAAVLLFLLAVCAGLAARWPERVRPELDGAPWPQIALAEAALGLALVRGWEMGRRAVRAVALLAAAAFFPLAGLFVARGLRGEALLVLASAWLLAMGFLALLAPDLPRLKTVASVLLIALGGAGLARFGPAEMSAAPEIGSWATGDQRIVDEEIGLTFVVPPGWVALKPGNSLVQAPTAARATLLQPRVSGYAYVVVEPPPAQVLLLEHYLDLVLAQRKGTAASFEEDGRRDGRLGSVESRRAMSRRSTQEGRFVERTVVARDRDRYFALVTWVPEAGGGRAIEEITSLETAVSLSGVRGAGQRDAVQRANLELPHLSVQAIQDLVESTGAATPSELFRRSLGISARGVASLGPSAAQELQALTAAALATLPRQERARLAEYLGRAAAGSPTLPQEDEQMRVLMKAAVMRLGATQRTRLEELSEGAIRAGESQGATSARP
ncbi:MAG: DUF4339 domain-containing protein [Vicinamibacteria bacterium]